MWGKWNLKYIGRTQITADLWLLAALRLLFDQREQYLGNFKEANESYHFMSALKYLYLRNIRHSCVDVVLLFVLAGLWGSAFLSSAFTIKVFELGLVQTLAQISSWVQDEGTCI